MSESEREPTEAPEAGESTREEPSRVGPATAERERPRGRGRGRRRACIMCVEKMTSVDYKDANFLRRYLSERARIDTRRKSSCCAKHQRAIAQAIKRARHLALLPYTADHIREAGVGPAR